MEHLSSSQISLYLQCPRKYRFKYIDCIEPPFKSAAVAFGSALHSAVAYLGEAKMKGDEINAGKLLSVFRADWEAQKCDKIVFNGESEEELLSKGVALLKQIHEEAVNWKVRGAEVPFQVPIIDPSTGEAIVPVNIMGFFDLVIEPDTIIELKTSVRKWDEESIKNNIQVSIYGYAYKLLSGRDANLQIKVLLKQRNPRIETYPTTRSDDATRWCLNLIREIYESIEKGAFHPTPGWMCADCEYAELCKSKILK